MHSKVQPAACQMQLSICSAGQAEERRSGRAAHGVGASFLSRTWPGVGGALMYRAHEPMVHAKLTQLSLLWCWPLPPWLVRASS